MVNTEIIRVGYKIYIITTSKDGVLVTTVGQGSKIEKREFKSIMDMPFEERFQLYLARTLNKEASK